MEKFIIKSPSLNRGNHFKTLRQPYGFAGEVDNMTTFNFFLQNYSIVFNEI